MFGCRACTLRYIQAIAGDGFIAPAAIQRPFVSTTRLQRRRLATTAQTARHGDHSTDRVPSSNSPEPVSVSDRRRAVAARRELYADDDPFSAEHTAPKPAPVTSSKGGPTVIEDEKALQMELRYLGDPAKLAEHVHYTLRNENPRKALDLCRLASRTEKVIVSWNHVINWHMRKGKINEAIRIYNEMKKRGQFPDSYTYSLLLRGFWLGSDNLSVEAKQENLVKALAIYNSMSSPTSRVQPTVIHTNAVLRVCTLAQDLDALWGVASKIPDHGPSAADHKTYSVILSAIRHGAFGKKDDSFEGSGDADIPAGVLAQKQQQAVDEGRRIWQEVVTKWRAGKVLIDEGLVVDMANLLLFSGRMRDWDDVLDLVRQTTGIERLIAPIGSPDRHTEHVADALQDELEMEAADGADEADDGWIPTPAAKAFHPVVNTPGNPNSTINLAWVQPGSGILKMLLRACVKMRTPRTANAYWDKLTSEEYGVRPDSNCLEEMLSLMRVNRQSARTAKILQDVSKRDYLRKQLTSKVFDLAMKTCQRDMKNRNVLQHATTVLEIMERSLSYPDVIVLDHFLSLALTTDNGPQIVAAIDRLDPFVHLIRSRITYGKEGGSMSPEEHATDKTHGVRLLRNMIGAIDTLMNRGLVPREEFNNWHARRAQLNSFVNRASGNVERQQQRNSEKRVESIGKTAAEDEARRLIEGARKYPRARQSAALREFRKRKPSTGDVLPSRDVLFRKHTTSKEVLGGVKHLREKKEQSQNNSPAKMPVLDEAQVADSPGGFGMK